MSRLPQLEAQLVEAAGRRPAPAPWRAPVAAVIAAAACAAVVALVAGGDSPAAREAAASAGVPAATLELSQSLAALPAPDPRDAVAHAALPMVAAALMAGTPYPPGLRDGFDWAATPDDPRSPAAIVTRADVQRLIEYRAYCLWLRYWVSVEGAARRDAAAVLADVARWPTQRGDARAGELAAAAQRGDAATVQDELDVNCRGVGS